MAGLAGDRAHGAAHGLRWSSGCGSSQRSRKVSAMAPTAGPWTSSLDVVPRRPVAVASSSSIACGSPRWRASSWRPWQRSMPPTKATSSSAPSRRRVTNELLVVAPAAPDALVEQDLAAGLVHLLVEREVLLLAEVRLRRVRPPEQPAHVHAAPGEVGEDVRELGAGPDEPLVGVALPVGEVDPVVAAAATHSSSYRRRKYSAPSTSTSTWLPALQPAALAPRSMRAHGLPRSSAVRNQSSTPPMGSDLPERR